jgi:hypothetical protein
MKSYTAVVLTLLAFCILANASHSPTRKSTVWSETEQPTADYEGISQRAEELKTACRSNNNRDACIEGAGGLAHDLFGYLNSALASSNDTFVSLVAPALQKSWQSVLNITEAISSAAEPSEQFFDTKLRNLTILCDELLKSLNQRTFRIDAAHANILKAARRSHIPGVLHS